MPLLRDMKGFAVQKNRPQTFCRYFAIVTELSVVNRVPYAINRQTPVTFELYRTVREKRPKHVKTIFAGALATF